MEFTVPQRASYPGIHVRISTQKNLKGKKKKDIYIDSRKKHFFKVTLWSSILTVMSAKLSLWRTNGGSEARVHWHVAVRGNGGRVLCASKLQSTHRRRCLQGLGFLKPDRFWSGQQWRWLEKWLFKEFLKQWKLQWETYHRAGLL